MSLSISNIRWTGDPHDIEEPWFLQFVAAGSLATPRLIWWIEPDISGQADLLLTYEQATDGPVRIRRGEWVYESGGFYGAGRMGIDGTVTVTRVMNTRQRP